MRIRRVWFGTGFVLAATVMRLAAAELATPASVTLTEKSASVVLANGIATVEIAKSSGNVLALEYQGRSLLAGPGYLNWHAGDEDTDFDDHNSTYGRITHGQFAIKTDPAANGGALAEVVVTRAHDAQELPFDLELHYVLRRGDAGFYAFVVFNHEKGYAPAKITQIRLLFRLKDEWFNFVAIDEQRRHLMPPSDTPTHPLGPKESLQITSGPFKGTIVDKYHDFVDAGEHFVHGWIGTESKLGCWIVAGSTEDQNGGPTKQYNTAHFGRVLMKIFSCTHYGAAPVEVGAEAWRKIYGPCFVYLNSGGSADELWADAKAKADAERAAWPYAWLEHPLYPLAAGRGAVSGQIKIEDPQDAAASAANAWVGLAAAQPDWQQQSNGYQFWVRADRDGRFAIPKVRPGTYTLYTFADGVMGQFRRDNVTVTPGRTLEIGVLRCTPARHGRQLWQIGTPDRTAREFRHGDDFREWGLWLKYPEEFPHGVNFVVGTSSERTDWNYAQPTVKGARKPAGTQWNILFDLAAAPKKGRATLRLALAGATNADLVVFVNGRSIGEITTGKDSAMIRAGIHGQYLERDLAFAATLLKGGANRITLDQRAGGAAQINVMYDCLRLELDDGDGT
ncbi:MAG TPA: polysaccharide lyase family protein [Opitutaceae bacterium]|nr:polysaccharide lyase family protein [Opitutaceae bacterium]